MSDAGTTPGPDPDQAFSPAPAPGAVPAPAEAGQATQTDTSAFGTRATLLPGHAQRVIVPIANPANAQDLLELAAALCVQGGDVIALQIVIGDDPPDPDVTAQFEDILAEVKQDRVSRTFEFVSRPATTVARGVLDAVQEERADLLVVGVPPAKDRTHVLGRIAETVIESSPCDVVVVRPGSAGPGIRGASRIVVGVDGDEESRTAARTAMVLADGLAKPVTVATVIDRGIPKMEGHAALGASLADLPGRAEASTEVLRGSDIATCLLGHSREGDIIVLGQHPRTVVAAALQRQSISAQMLARSPHPVIIVARSTVQSGSGAALRRWLARLRPSLTADEAESLRWTARRQSALTADYVALIALSAVLASLGLAQNSVAVIIGAMLVAPLLGPLSAVSIGIVTTRINLWERGLVTLFAGTSIAVAFSIGLGLLLPLAAPTSQMLLRGNPTLLDLGVAIASGAVGAFATVRKEVPAALAGVAIAAALVPPICTIGLGIALGEGGLAAGAALLYAVNIAAVIATGAATFYWLGLRPVDDQDGARRKSLVSAALSLGLTLAVVTALVTLTSSQRDQETAEQDLQQELEIGDARVADVELEEDPNGVLVVTATVRTDGDLEPDDVAEAQSRLEAELEREVVLRLVVQRLLTSDG